MMVRKVCKCQPRNREETGTYIHLTADQIYRWLPNWKFGKMAEKLIDWLQSKTVYTDYLIKMDEDDEKVEVDGQLTAESIKSISESMGISNLNDEAINLLIDDGTYRLKQLAQVSDVLHVYRLVSDTSGQLRSQNRTNTLILQVWKNKNCSPI